MKKKKISKRQQIKSKTLIIISLVLLFIIVTCAVVIPTTIHNRKEIYQVESRVDKIKETKKKDNNDYETTGWLRVQGTNIDVPIINYLNKKTVVPVELGNYVWNLSGTEKLTEKVNIMGHNIMNLSAHPEINREYFSRFDDLMSFIYYDFAKDNKYIQYTVDGKDYVYKIFSVYLESAYRVDLYGSDTSHKEKVDQIKRYQEKSFYKYDVDVNENDNIISLMTCTRIYGTEEKVSFIVSGRQLRENEKMTDYSVKETKNYNRAKKIVKGDVENDKL